MPGLFSAINIGAQSLLANQRAIAVVSHNVANVNTEGFHRQEAVFQAGPAYGDYKPGMFGTGVLIDRIDRFSIDFLDRRYRQEISESSQYQAIGTVLEHTEAIMGELTDGGVIAKLDNFWDSWQNLANDPTKDALKSAVREQGEILADAFSSRMNDLDNILRNQNLSLETLTLEINERSVEIARLNEEIRNYIARGQQPNDMLDQRDLLLDRLAEVAGATSYMMDNGEVNVSIGSHILIYGKAVQELEFDTVTNTITWEDGASFNPSSGEIDGVLEARQAIEEQQDGLNEIAGALISWVNDVHQTVNQTSNVQTDSDTALNFSAGNFWIGGNGTAATAVTDANSVITGTTATNVNPPPAATHRELGTGTYSIETRDNAGVSQFRLLDADGDVVEIDDGSGNLTNNWVTFADGGGATHDTGRGLEITFDDPRASGDLGNTATITYTAAGIDLTNPVFVGAGNEILASDSLRDIARKINLTTLEQPEGTVATAFIVDNQLFLKPQEAGTNHAVIASSSLTDGAGGSLTFTAGQTPPAFFAGNDARSIRLSDEVKDSLDNISTSIAPGFAPGDGSIAQFMADGRLADNFVVSGEYTNINEAYNLQLTNLGLQINYASGSLRDREVVASAINEQREAFVGVSLDEEAVLMMRYQKAFQASSKLISVANQMLDILMGIV